MPQGGGGGGGRPKKFEYVKGRETEKLKYVGGGGGKNWNTPEGGGDLRAFLKITYV